MGIELEWKYDLPEALSFEELLAWDPLQSRMAEAPRRLRMQTTYYDTADRRLSERKITLRRRLENDSSVVCCKAPLPGAGRSARRGEWELEADDPIEALPRLTALGAPSLLTETRDYLPVCGAEFLRTAVLLRFADGSAAELALDAGTLRAPAASLPFRVLELELKEGAPGAALGFVRSLAARFGLRPQKKSKYARARELD